MKFKTLISRVNLSVNSMFSREGGLYWLSIIHNKSENPKSAMYFPAFFDLPAFNIYLTLFETLFIHLTPLCGCVKKHLSPATVAHCNKIQSKLS